jgi:hypothetical protein
MAAVYAEFVGIIRRRREVVLSGLDNNLRRTFLHADAVAPTLILIDIENTHVLIPLLLYRFLSAIRGLWKSFVRTVAGD